MPSPGGEEGRRASVPGALSLSARQRGGCALCMLAAVVAFRAPAAPAVVDETDALTFDAGVHLRVRETCVRNAPGLPGGGSAVQNSSVRKVNSQGFRFDSYPWAGAFWRGYSAVFGLGHAFSESMKGSVLPHHSRAYRFPDVLFVNNLYVAGTGAFDGLVDFTVGRQDLSKNGHSVFGLDRILFDGTPGDSSISVFTDMARFTFHTAEKRRLDLFALHCDDRNELSMGLRQARRRGLNRLTASDSRDMDQWGAGAIWGDDAINGLPYKLYAIYKEDLEYSRRGERQPGKRIATLGVNALPRLSDDFSLDLDFAKQAGRRTNGRVAGGEMAYAGVAYRRSDTAFGFMRPYGTAGVLYLSGDKHRLGPDDSDTAWDPMWRRISPPSEIFSNGAHPGFRYWTNMMWAKTLIGVEFGPRHSVEAYSGPIFAPAKDGLGGGDSSFKGVLSRINYRFPLLLAPKGASGADRCEVWGAACIELFNPGGYYESSRPALYMRWMLNFRF